MNRFAPQPHLVLPLLLVFVFACAGTKPEASKPQVDFAQAPEVPLDKPEKREPLSFAEEVQMADSLRDSGQLPEAAWHYIRSMQIDDENPIPKQRLGYMQLSRDVDRAQKIFSDLVLEHPDLATGHLGLGLAHVARGELDTARPALEQAISLDPSLAVAYMGLGMVHDKQGEHGLAQVQYEHAQDQDPARYEIKNNLGMSHLMSGNFGQAAQSFRDAIFLEPRDPTLYNNLAVALARQGDYKAAYQNFRRYSNEADALNNLGYVSLMNSDFERAIKYFERSLLEGPTERKTVLVNMRVAEDAMLTNMLRID
jgi:Flp pilus assembly protein TadD